MIWGNGARRLMRFFVRCSVPVLALAFSTIASAQLLLTGAVAAKNAEVFYAPKVTDWKIQIEWMMPEGQIAKPGDLVVLFDRASIDSEIELKEADLLKAQEQLKLSQSEQAEKLLEAKFDYQKAQLELQKAQIDADVDPQYVSVYQHEKDLVELEKRKLAVDKFYRQWQTQQRQGETELEKKRTEIKKTQYKLDDLRQKSVLTAVKTKNGGPMVYAHHPWDGSKLTSGSSAQATWKVAEIAASKEMQIVAWLNEVDKTAIALGSPVRVTADALPQRVFNGVVSAFVPQAEAKDAWGTAAYFRLEIEIEDYQDAGLVPGMSVLVELNEGG